MSANGLRPPATERVRALVLRPARSLAEGGPGRTDEGRLAEAVGLALAIDLEVVGDEVIRLRRARSGTLLGPGTVTRIGERVAEDEIALVVVDAALTPVQQRNLERAWSCKVIDRAGLILEIFGERATTREGSLQVELAALSYQRSRLVRSWTHLERQRGALGFVGGPGESQLELDRRRIDERIVRLKRDLEGVKRTRGLNRAARERVPFPVVALVGYTNAGKSTLFNRLTEAQVVVRDQLFATLDPTMRLVTLPSGRRIILSDTVGFVADLPTDLIAAFRATLEEVCAADIVVHVRDVTHEERDAQRDDVQRVLADLGLEDLEVEERLIELWNKADRLDADERARVEGEAALAGAIVGSARTGAGIDALLAAIDRRLDQDASVFEIVLDPADGARLAWLYRHGNVLERAESDSRIRLRVALTPLDQARLVGSFPASSIVSPREGIFAGGR